MILSAMMFALGTFVSGLVWIAFSVALVRRARRLTERRLLAGIATRRAEFDAERDELRARHAVQMHRLEREVSRVLDMATAYRLEADLKERDLINARAEIEAHHEDFADVEVRLKIERNSVQELERRHAEAGSALRAAQHQLNLESRRRAAAEEALEEASVLADQRRIALSALRAENNALRERLGEEPAEPLPYELEAPKLPRALTAMEAELDPEFYAGEPAIAAETAKPAPVAAEAEKPAMGGSVVPLPTRPRPVPVEVNERSAAASVNRHDETRPTEADGGDGAAQPRMPQAPVPGVANIGELVALRMLPAEESVAEAKPEVSEKAESQFFEALAEIRALKRAANQAGE